MRCLCVISSHVVEIVAICYTLVAHILSILCAANLIKSNVVIAGDFE